MSIPNESKQTLHQAALCGMFWGAWAVGCYTGIYLQDLGFTASDIGVLNAICALVGVISVSFWGTMADRVGSVRKIETIMLIVGGLGFVLIPLIGRAFGGTVWIFLLCIPAINFFRAHTSTFNENLIVRNANELRLNYGRIRAIGSFIFTVFSVITSLILDKIGVPNTFWICSLLMIPVVVLTFTSHEPASNQASKSKKEKKKLDLKPLLKSRRYMFFLVFTFLFYIAANCESAFIPYYMRDIGVPTSYYGILLGYRALFEIPFLLLMIRLRRKFSLRIMTILGALLMGLECIGLSLFVSDLVSLLLFATLFGLGNGLFIGGALNYVYEIAPEGLKASAHGFFTATAQISAIVGNLVGGYLYDAVGARTFYMIAFGVYLLSIAVLYFSGRRRKQSPKTPLKAAESA